MIEISLDKLGKRYNRDWLFRNWSDRLHSNESYVILGGNGSGKSTALKTLAGYASQSEGTINYSKKGEKIDRTEVYKISSFCSPYLELYEELTIDELTAFHFSLKPIISRFDTSDFIDLIELSHAKKKPVKYFSSGMKQRLRIGLALYSDTDILFLDEPTSNLDRKGKDWYMKAVGELKENRLVLVASNRQEEEYYFCNQKIDIEQFKKS
jgi:ABC-type multidrug transport system ATPase subunit